MASDQNSSSGDVLRQANGSQISTKRTQPRNSSTLTSANFLSLPPEVRQSILAYTLSDFLLKYNLYHHRIGNGQCPNGSHIVPVERDWPEYIRHMYRWKWGSGKIDCRILLDIETVFQKDRQLTAVFHHRHRRCKLFKVCRFAL